MRVWGLGVPEGRSQRATALYDERLFLMFTFVACERDDLITHYGILSQFFSQHFTQNLLNLREKKSVCV
jgi:hypothetical protein